MPELPEVLTIKKDLQKEILGKRVIDVFNSQNYPFRPSEELFEKYVRGFEINEVDNIAKLITLKMSSKYYIATHLNMSGRLLYNNKDPYIKITIRFEDNSELHYSSVRMFGYFEVWDQEKVSNYKKKYAKTALDPTLTIEDFLELIKTKKTNIKDLLLNQKVISGIGNIYANDALFLSEIHPQETASQIPVEKAKTLLDNIRLVLNEGISHRGSTIDRYCDIYGKPGSHQQHFRVYKKQKCPACNKDVQFTKVSGRGTYYCLGCQPKTMQMPLL